MNGIEMEMDRQAGRHLYSVGHLRGSYSAVPGDDDRKRRVNDDPRVPSSNRNSFVPIMWHFDNYFQFLSIAAIHLCAKQRRLNANIIGYIRTKQQPVVYSGDVPHLH